MSTKHCETLVLYHTDGKYQNFNQCDMALNSPSVPCLL